MARSSSCLLAVVLGLARPAAAQSGALVSVTSTPEGTVLLDGTSVGPTPLTALPVGAGRHRLEVDVPGQPPAVRDLDVVDGQVLTIELGHRPQPAPPVVAPALAAPAAPAVPPQRSWLTEVPWETWAAGGVAFAAFGVGLGFGVAASNIDHQAGVNVSPTGVDLGLTRATAVAGQQDANVANALFIGAGVAAVVGLAFAAFWPEPAAPAPLAPAAPEGAK